MDHIQRLAEKLGTANEQWRNKLVGDLLAQAPRATA
jgi:hypothetical protein